ncbi:MAG: SDR family NAD(P)-dependent oxidoreductase [Alphaproteobacteria bacterium]|nr:MAG: SDR family NAD(P)-dependent oxidoreductase [Alphaproteobacteria bacterium]
MAALAGRHALVTGGGTGIGLAIATALAEHGAQVTITGRREGPLAEAAAAHEGLHPLVMDVTDEANVEAGFAAAQQARGPVTIHVANAGIAETAPMHKETLAHWRKVLATNLDGVFLTTRAALRQMRSEGWGRIITISSIAGLRGLKYGAAYSTSKHGVIGLTRVVSEECMGSGITANAICPGYVRTPIVEENAKLIAARSGISEEAAIAAMVKDNRHGRLIEPEEIAAAAVWLCLPGSESVNGQTIPIAGGQV